jgi:hypothetical protein
MEEQEPIPPMNAGELFMGLCDALVTFGVVFANAGLVTREEIAAMCVRSLDQIRLQEQLEGREPSQARMFALENLRRVFSYTVMEGGRGAAGLVAIDGGKVDEPPAA